MKTVFLISALIAVLTGFFNRISEMNTLKNHAEHAYKSNDFHLASELYLLLTKKYKTENEKVIQNLAHSLFQSGQLEKSESWYQKLTLSSDNKIRSLALNQLGIIYYELGNSKNAFANFRQAIIESPSNIFAVYNYELLKKAEEEMAGKPENQEATEAAQGKGEQKIKSTGASREGKSEQGPGKLKERVAGEGELQGEQFSSERRKGNDTKALQESKNHQDENKDLKSTPEGNKSKEDFVSNRLKNYGISTDKALQLLDAMNNEEIMYLQQLKRKSEGSNNDLPDY